MISLKTIYIALGSNKGNKLQNLQAAVDAIFVKVGAVNRISKVYQTPAIGFEGDDFFNACIGSREWENKDGYINNDLYLPRMSKDGIPVETIGKEPSRLLAFDRGTHVRALVKKETDANQTAANFEGQSGSGSDFEL